MYEHSTVCIKTNFNRLGYIANNVSLNSHSIGRATTIETLPHWTLLDYTACKQSKACCSVLLNGDCHTYTMPWLHHCNTRYNSNAAERHKKKHYQTTCGISFEVS